MRMQADSCADVDVRAFVVHAPYHARCGLTGTGMHDDAPMHVRTHTHTIMGSPRIMSPSCSHPRRDRAGTAPILVHIRARTEADLRCD